GKKLDSLPADFYSTRNYTDTLISYIDRHKADGKPFFMFAAYTAPHDPLHAPKEYIDKYKGKFDMGWDSLRNLRLENLKALGIVPKDLNGYFPNPSVPKWETLSHEQKEDYARDMEVYAAMVDYLDMSIGRLIDYLKKEGMYDNTAIVFMSDNGANGAMATAYPGNDDGKYLGGFNNKMENRGLPGSYIEMGPGWAQASSSPFRLFKGFSTEGGIKAPLIFKMPGSMKNPGQWNSGFAHVTDLMPTFLALADVTFSENYKGRKVKAPIGRSLVPVLNDSLETVHENNGMGWELFEMKSYIKGKWKILRLPQPFGTGDWQLFDLTKDPAEVNDLSLQNSAIRSELINEWNEYAKANEVFDHKGWYDEAYLEKFKVTEKH
ncbi:MAG TPA: sulfatase-like hydrolase/transferase, partial [Chitinophagaceae bacterium]